MKISDSFNSKFSNLIKVKRLWNMSMIVAAVVLRASTATVLFISFFRQIKFKFV